MGKKFKIAIVIFISLLLIGSVFVVYNYFTSPEKVKLDNTVILEKDGELYSTDIVEIISRDGKDYLISPDGKEFLLLQGLGNKRFRILNDTGEVIGLDHYGNIQLIGNLTANDATMNGYGFFRYIGESITRVTKGWFGSLDVSGSINATEVNGSTVYANNVNVSTWATNVSLNYTQIVNSIWNQTWNYNYSGNITGSTNWTQVMVGNYNLTWNYNYTKNYTSITFTTYNSTWDNNWANTWAYNQSTLFNLQNVLNGTGIYSSSTNHTNIVFSLYNSTWDNSYLNSQIINHTSTTFTIYNSTWNNNWINQFAYNHSSLFNLQNVLNGTGVYSSSTNHTSVVFSLYNATWDNSYLNSLNWTNTFVSVYNSTWNYNYSFNYSNSLLNSYNNWTYNQTYAQDLILSQGKKIYLGGVPNIYSNVTCAIIGGTTSSVKIC